MRSVFAIIVDNGSFNSYPSFEDGPLKLTAGASVKSDIWTNSSAAFLLPYAYFNVFHSQIRLFYSIFFILDLCTSRLFAR